VQQTAAAAAVDWCHFTDMHATAAAAYLHAVTIISVTKMMDRFLNQQLCGQNGGCAVHDAWQGAADLSKTFRVSSG
jgi:hypothetical protein